MEKLLYNEISGRSGLWVDVSFQPIVDSRFDIGFVFVA